MALHYLAENAFSDLLRAWDNHHRVKHKPRSTVPEKGRSRLELEAARDRMYRLRSAMYPNPEEQEAVLFSVLCDHLDEIVHLGWSQLVGISATGPNAGHFRCPCGELVRAPANLLQS